jgi:uncharacterized protein (DUF1330 family)
MKANYQLAIALLAGAAVGALAVQGLHAQAKPVAYVIAEVDVTNPEAYAKEYIPVVTKVLQEGGAKFLARGGKTASFSGEPPKARVAMTTFENMEKALALFASPAYVDAQKLGEKYAKFRVFAVEGVSPQ